ncbi:major capsid protein [Streptosporangium minutum]|uniref:Phage capsid protein n=1 Tax=Streptosporangium minutum TaxID=569862 RepID=A0A243RXR0_9ACTN|nr:phage capsid protein [Streptosporangium minutum]OUC99323.1 phage capsid protein [Streptosporangium minutum]
MPVSLAQAKLNTTDDVDLQVIDEFQKSSFLLDALTFDDVVSGAGNGATLTYAYQRLITQPTAAFRAINSEYTPAEVTKQRYSVDLKPLGGSFQIDRVLDRMAAGAETALQMSQKIKAANAFFSDQVINGDSAVTTDGFDGLSKILTGTSTEYLPLSNGVTTGYIDMTTIDTKAEALAFMAHIDSWLALMDGTPDAIFGNRKTLALFKYAAAWSEMIDKTTDSFGRPVQAYNGIRLIDLGAKAGSNTAVIDLVTRDADAGGAGGNITGLGDLYAARFGLDGFHGVSMAGRPLVQTWLPDFTRAGAVKTGEVELGPVAPVLKATKAAAVFRNLKSA